MKRWRKELNFISSVTRSLPKQPSMCLLSYIWWGDMMLTGICDEYPLNGFCSWVTYATAMNANLKLCFLNNIGKHIFENSRESTCKQAGNGESQRPAQVSNCIALWKFSLNLQHQKIPEGIPIRLKNRFLQLETSKKFKIWIFTNIFSSETLSQCLKKEL